MTVPLRLKVGDKAIVTQRGTPANVNSWNVPRTIATAFGHVLPDGVRRVLHRQRLDPT